MRSGKRHVGGSYTHPSGICPRKRELTQSARRVLMEYNERISKLRARTKVGAEDNSMGTRIRSNNHHAHISGQA